MRSRYLSLIAALCITGLVLMACQPITMPETAMDGEAAVIADSSSEGSSSEDAVAEACATLPESGVHLTILHLNDVYEITPVSGGTQGGMARVATIRQQLLEANPNTIVTLAGDIYNPSGLGTAVVDGERLDGKQVVGVMNKAGIDYMTFGDHEIDMVSEEQFADRLAATEFKIVSSNVFDVSGEPFSFGDTTVMENDLFVVSNENGDEMRVGIFAVTEPIPNASWEFSYVEWQEATAAQVELLAEQTDFLIALTHHKLASDKELAEQFPAVDIILGGDEHQITKVESEGHPTIYKSDSNARNNFVIDVCYDSATGDLQIEDRVQAITSEIADDPATLEETNYWVEQAFDAFRAEGWDPTEVLAEAAVDLNGFSPVIRNEQNALTELITQAMMDSAPKSELAILCSCRIRIDDMIPAGANVTRYDILRLFPMGDPTIDTMAFPGSLLEEVLAYGLAGIGSGDFLLTTPNVKEQDGTWMINDEPLDPERTYQVAAIGDILVDYLIYVNQERISEISVVEGETPLRQAVSEALQTAAK